MTQNKLIIINKNKINNVNSRKERERDEKRSEREKRRTTTGVSLVLQFDG